MIFELLVLRQRRFIVLFIISRRDCRSCYHKKLRNVSIIFRLTKPVLFQVFKKRVREILFAILHAEDTYVEAPTFLLTLNLSEFFE